MSPGAVEFLHFVAVAHGEFAEPELLSLPFVANKIDISSAYSEWECVAGLAIHRYNDVARFCVWAELARDFLVPEP